MNKITTGLLNDPYQDRVAGSVWDTAKDINVEDAYPKPLVTTGVILGELPVGDEIKLPVSPMRGIAADFDGDYIHTFDRVYLCRRLRKPSKYKKGPRKGRPFLHPHTARYVLSCASFGASVYYINHFKRVKKA